MKPLLAHQQATYNNAVYQLPSSGITQFTLDALYVYIENVKYPFFKREREQLTTPFYIGEANYGPIVKKMVERGILVESAGIYTVKN